MLTRNTRDSRAFGDAAIPAFGNATKKKLKRPYLRSVVRKGRKLINKHKIGQVEANRREFKWVTRGGGVYAAKVSGKGGRKPARKAARKGPHHRKGQHHHKGKKK